MIEDRIRKLLAMAEHPNTNPHEAANAAARAAHLAAEHNVDLQRLRDSGDASVKKFEGKLGPTQFKVVDMNAFGVLVNSVGRLYVAVPLFYNRKRPPMRYSFKGQAHNVDLAISWTEYLWESCKRANTEHTRKQDYGSPKIREAARQSFRLFFCHEVAKRLTDKYREMTTPTSTSDSRALAVINYMVQEYQEIEKGMGPITQIEGPKARMLANAAIAGRDAGRKVSLDAQITGTQRAEHRRIG